MLVFCCFKYLKKSVDLKVFFFINFLKQSFIIEFNKN